MIASLRGIVSAIGLDFAVLDCNGVGYQVTATPNTLAKLHRGEEAIVLTTMVVREDAMKLYGFIDQESREMFALLQTVSGLGPRLALACESVLSPAEISQAIAAGDAKTLQRVPGVGKRMADRLIVELKDKVSIFASENSLASIGASPVQAVAPVVLIDQVTQALIGLGFSESQADLAVAAVVKENPEVDTPTALRAALARLSGK